MLVLGSKAADDLDGLEYYEEDGSFYTFNISIRLVDTYK